MAAAILNSFPLPPQHIPLPPPSPSSPSFPSSSRPPPSYRPPSVASTRTSSRASKRTSTSSHHLRPPSSLSLSSNPPPTLPPSAPLPPLPPFPSPINELDSLLLLSQPRRSARLSASLGSTNGRESRASLTGSVGGGRESRSSLLVPDANDYLLDTPRARKRASINSANASQLPYLHPPPPMTRSVTDPIRPPSLRPEPPPPLSPPRTDTVIEEDEAQTPAPAPASAPTSPTEKVLPPPPATPLSRPSPRTRAQTTSSPRTAPPPTDSRSSSPDISTLIASTSRANSRTRSQSRPRRTTSTPSFPPPPLPTNRSSSRPRRPTRKSTGAIPPHLGSRFSGTEFEDDRSSWHEPSRNSNYSTRTSTRQSTGELPAVPALPSDESYRRFSFAFDSPGEDEFDDYFGATAVDKERGRARVRRVDEDWELEQDLGLLPAADSRRPSQDEGFLGARASDVVRPASGVLPMDDYGFGHSSIVEEHIMPEEDVDSDSSLDIHTPLPHLMVKAGLLSPRSKILDGFAKVEKDGKLGAPRDMRDTEQRRTRHRDGRLLRDGVGLTTGLGWSDSEDEGAPSALTRRLSTLDLSNVSARRASTLALSSPPPASLSRHPSLAAAASALSQSSASSPMPSPRPRAATSTLSAPATARHSTFSASGARVSTYSSGSRYSTYSNRSDGSSSGKGGYSPLVGAIPALPTAARARSPTIVSNSTSASRASTASSTLSPPLPPTPRSLPSHSPEIAPLPSLLHNQEGPPVPPKQIRKTQSNFGLRTTSLGLLSVNTSIPADGQSNMPPPPSPSRLVPLTLPALTLSKSAGGTKSAMRPGLTPLALKTNHPTSSSPPSSFAAPSTPLTSIPRQRTISGASEASSADAVATRTSSKMVAPESRIPGGSYIRPRTLSGSSPAAPVTSATAVAPPPPSIRAPSQTGTGMMYKRGGVVRAPASPVGGSLTGLAAPGLGARKGSSGNLRAAAAGK